MSLHKQLWLAVTTLMLLALLGGFVVSSLSARTYLEQQLTIKNNDNANALALALSASTDDRTLLELAVAAQFDTGFYKSIILRDPEGNVLVERLDTRVATDTPVWLTRLFPIEAEPGLATVQQGWQIAGSITLESHTRYAYAELWSGAKRLAVYLVGVALAAGALGSLLLRYLVRPLDQVVEQASALSERRFITTSEPSTPELRRVVRSMNTLAVRVRDMLQQEASRLAEWQHQVHYDAVTGLMGRTFFLEHLDAALRRDAETGQGVIILLRLQNLGRINQTLGHDTSNLLLQRCGIAIKQLVAKCGDRWSAGRLNGTDIALLAPETGQPLQLGRELHSILRAVAEELHLSQLLSAPAAAIGFTQGQTRSEVLSRADASLALACADGGWSLRGSIDNLTGAAAHSSLDVWRQRIDEAFKTQAFSLQTYPCRHREGALIHREAMIRLRYQEQALPAAAFLPWVNRLERAAELDIVTLELAQAYLKEQGSKLAINLSSTTLADPSALQHFTAKLAALPKGLGLSIEVPESVAFRNLPALRQLASVAHSREVLLGLDRIGQQIAQLGKLHDIGVDYVKIDGALLGGIEHNPVNAALLRTLATMLHAVGITVIADGISTEAELAMARALGLDGFSGPAVVES